MHWRWSFVEYWRANLVIANREPSIRQLDHTLKHTHTRLWTDTHMREESLSQNLHEHTFTLDTHTWTETLKVGEEERRNF